MAARLEMPEQEAIRNLLNNTDHHSFIHSASEDENFCFNKGRLLYLPVRYIDPISDYLRHYSILYYRVIGELKNFKRSIVDESIPLEWSEITLDEEESEIWKPESEDDYEDCDEKHNTGKHKLIPADVFLTGDRRGNLMMIDFFNYYPALPELREAMLHDLDAYFRLGCVDAIGKMGGKAYPYIPDIIKVMQEDPDFYTRSYAAKALGRLGAKCCLNIIREMYEEVIYLLNRNSRGYDFSKEEDLSKFYSIEEDTDLLHLLEEIMETLIIIDPKTAKECLALAMLNSNPHIRHFAITAFYTHPVEYHLIAAPMKHSRTAIFNGLPKDHTPAL